MTSSKEYAKDPLIQVNFRLPTSMKARVVTRAERVGISRDEWVRRALEYALSQPQTQRRGTTIRRRRT